MTLFSAKSGNRQQGKESFIPTMVTIEEYHGDDHHDGYDIGGDDEDDYCHHHHNQAS